MLSLLKQFQPRQREGALAPTQEPHPEVVPSHAWVALCAMPIAERMSFTEVYEVVTCGDKAVLESYSPRLWLWDLYWAKPLEVRTNG